ncbi:molybdopterin-dependent oxidoreductase [Methylotetracoccus oryzae]|uniref:molybdopterin-dependent oxidoreductase n=1 Tax=Methylotetracoccus oryzae TaxID=1919059 RepID=UPI00111B2652|nr:molybdopterin-dependent oxidoreductase [Methylotetracoccus oryzae]
MSGRRQFLKTLAGAAGGALLPAGAWCSESRVRPATLPAGTVDSAVMAALPGKQALIKRTYRPPNYETPLAEFQVFYTPNDRFFVRYHLSAIPEVDLAQWQLKIGGDAVAKPMAFTLAELRRNFEVIELPALCLCAGNRRGLFQPHSPGIQWGQGAMGNALWQGVRLRDVLARASLAKDALEVTFEGADSGVFPSTPDFSKSLPLAKALDENTLIAFAMNGEPLPHWNGFPARLVVPGWAASYWLKHLTGINVVSRPLDSFWMKSAYRLPKGLFVTDARFPSQETDTTAAITELLVNSLIVSPEEGQGFRPGQPIEVKGMAWDGGQGIERVDVSTDGGATWQAATMEPDRGRFTWRPWSYLVRTARTGDVTVKVRATNRAGQVQASEPVANPAGYHHNAVQSVTVHVG